MVTDARTALLDAAERLYAERGIGSVSLREVGAAAGQRNNSAAQYHFGSREGLLLAVFERRMGPINERRRAALAALDAEGRGDDRRALVEALVLPLADAVTSGDDVPTGGSTYARFLTQVLASGLVGSGEEELTEAFREVHRRLVGGLDHVPTRLRRLRVDHAVLLVVHALASWEQAQSLGRLSVDSASLHVDLVDSTVGLLDAPSSSPATSTAPAAPTLELAC